MIIEQIKKLLGHRYEALNRLEISRANLTKNYRYLSTLNRKIKVAPVLKSNGYGHGLVTVAKVLDPLNPPFFCVDSIYEAYKLLKAGIKSKILIMGYINPQNLAVKPLPFSYVVYEAEQMKEILKYQPEAGIHIFVDTGMNREGLRADEVDQTLKKISDTQRSNIEGIMSHFAAAGNTDSTDTKNQVKNFGKAVKIFHKNNIFPKWKHIANSSGLLNNKTLGLDKISNLARPGVATYGIDPERKNTELKPALKFITHIVQIKKIKKGEKIGYDFTYIAQKDSITAVLPVGYNDGVDRGLSNIGKMLVGGKICPIVGRVSMNITIIDIHSVPGAKVGNEVAVYSDDNRFPNSIKNSSLLTDDKLEYQFLTSLNPEIKRVVV